MYPRKTSFSKKSINTSQQQPKFILKPVDETIDSMNTSYLEMYQQSKSNNAGQKLQQILQKQITQSQSHKNRSVEDDRLSRQQFINRSQQVVRQDVRGSEKDRDEDLELQQENKILKQQVRKLQLELQQSKNQNQLLIQDFEKLRDQLERQSDEFNQAFDLINEEKQLIQQEINQGQLALYQKDQIIQQLRSQIIQPSKTQQQIDEIKNRILARKSQHRNSRENITTVLNEMDQSARQEIKENLMDYNNRYPIRQTKINQQ